MFSQKINEDDEILYILNENNKLIPPEFISSIINEYTGFKPKKIPYMELFQRAMVHRSYLIRDPNYENKKQVEREREKDLEMKPIEHPELAVQLQPLSYERLEFLGDSVIHNVLADYLYHRYDEEDEGFMTKLRTRIENKEYLASLGKKVGLSEYVLISRRMDAHDARNKNPSIIEDSFEAFIGAMYENFGFEICKKFLFSLIEKEVDFVDILNTEINHKDRLLRYYHENKWRDPKYEMIENDGTDKMFSMYVTDKDGKPFAFGVGLSKKKGEQMAAKNALIKLGIIENDKCKKNDDDSYETDSDASLDDLEIIDD
jgi:dsRNA-specific ribonuclease